MRTECGELLLLRGVDGVVRHGLRHRHIPHAPHAAAAVRAPAPEHAALVVAQHHVGAAAVPVPKEQVLCGPQPNDSAPLGCQPTDSQRHFLARRSFVGLFTAAILVEVSGSGRKDHTVRVVAVTDVRVRHLLSRTAAAKALLS